MPKQIVTELTCDCCETTARELPGLVNTAGWITFKVKSASDGRKRPVCALCPDCVKAVLAAATKPEPRQEARPEERREDAHPKIIP